MLVLSSIFWRSTWKYRARAYRYCFWDAGTMLANLLAAAGGREDIGAEIVTAFDDPEIEPLLGLDGDREGARAWSRSARTRIAPGAIAGMRPLAIRDDRALARAKSTYEPW